MHPVATAGPALPSPATSAEPGAQLTAVPNATVYPIDLSTALRLAEVENPQIAQARTAILEALAVQQGARALMLPNLNAGATYHGHTGNLQRSSGTIHSLSEQSLYVGGGARVLAAETLGVPMVNITSPLTDAIYAPLAARQRLEGARFDASATFNAVLLDVALLHLDLLSAEAILQVRRQTEAEASEVARLTSSYAQAGEGPIADANRAATELKHRQLQVEQAEEGLAVAAARLALRLHLAPSVQLRTIENQLAPVGLIDPSAATEDLIRVALQQRPEVGARAAALAQAEVRFRLERARPFLPFIWLGFSGGVFGGGSNLVPPFLGNFAGRTDFDLRAIWTLQNFGLGNLAFQRRRQAEIGRAVAEQSRVIARIRREVTAAQALALAYRGQISVAQHQVETAEAGYREDFLRIKERARRALPIELVDSLDLLAEARRNKILAVFGYNRAQLQLFVALGSPPPLPDPIGPSPSPPPIAAPPLPPLGSNPIPTLPEPRATAAAGSGIPLGPVTR